MNYRHYLSNAQDCANVSAGPQCTLLGSDVDRVMCFEHWIPKSVLFHFRNNLI